MENKGCVLTGMFLIGLGCGLFMGSWIFGIIMGIACVILVAYQTRNFVPSGRRREGYISGIGFFEIED
jgi:hypothetical protein